MSDVASSRSDDAAGNKSKVKAGKKDINKKKAAIISDLKNANLLLDIINYNQVSFSMLLIVFFQNKVV